MRILGLDPGLQRTGWGVVDAVGARLSPVAAGIVATDARADTAVRLMQLHHGLAAVIAEHRPDAAAVEETFVNKNPVSTLKLGQARGVVLLAPALAGLPVVEYAPNLVKKSVVGAGHAGKEQVMAVVRMLLPAMRDWERVGADAADALAVAICHAHHAQTQARWAAAGA